MAQDTSLPYSSRRSRTTGPVFIATVSQFFPLILMPFVPPILPRLKPKATETMSDDLVQNVRVLNGDRGCACR